MNLNRLCCPLCGTWTVPYRAVPDYGNGGPDTVTGQCETCETELTARPTLKAVAIVKARLDAMAGIARVASAP